MRLEKKCRRWGWRSLLFVSFNLLISAPASAAIDLNLLGVLNFISPNYSDTSIPQADSSGGTSLGFGVMGGIDLLPGFRTELGLIYLPQEFTATRSGTNTETKVKYLQIPLIARFTGLPFFNVGAGGHFSLAVGDAEVKTTTGGVSTAQFLGRDQANISSTDWGLIASLQTKSFNLATVHLLGEIRYVLGLHDINTSSNVDVKFNDFQILAGVGINI